MEHLNFVKSKDYNICMGKYRIDIKTKLVLNYGEAMKQTKSSQHLNLFNGKLCLIFR